MEVLVLWYHFRTTIINSISLEDDPLNLVNETISVVGGGGRGDIAISPHTPVSSLHTCPPRKFSMGGGILGKLRSDVPDNLHFFGRGVFLVSSDPKSLTIFNGRGEILFLVSSNLKSLTILNWEGVYS